MNLREERGLRAIAHALLALIGLVLLASGLAMLSGLARSGPPAAATTLVMVRPPPGAARPAGREVGSQLGRRVAAPRSGDLIGRAAAPAPPPANRRPQPQRSGPRKPPARLAIVIDDIGHSVEAVQGFAALPQPLTFSVLPAVPHAREAAALIRRAGREYLIHLPMEPFDYPAQDPGPRPLLLSHGMEETARRVRGYLETLPHAIGASNHMGSAYTWDADRMRVVQTVLAERDLFFLNSRTSGTPVPAEVSRQWGYPYLERDVFLDHDPAERAIERAFHYAVRRAQARGRAVAIGHPYPQTLRVLRRHLPGLSARGVRLVPLSVLVGR